MIGRRRKRPPKIEPGLALAMAGQISVGLMTHAEPKGPVADADKAYLAEVEFAAQRARMALTAIGLMLANASDDPEVGATLEIAGTHVVRPLPGGGMQVEPRDPRR